MIAHETGDLLAYAMIEAGQRIGQHGVVWHEFLRAPSLSMGLYLLAEGAADPQKPHSEDEVYYVVGGQGAIRVGDEDRAVSAGSIVYVPARELHHFHSITEPLIVLVFFAPAENSQAE